MRQEGVARTGWSTAQLVALGSLLVDCLIVSGKLLAGVMTGSLGLISDGVHSSLDLVASCFAFLAIRTAAKPADREHPFGHARAENLAAFCEGILLLVASLVIGYQGVTRLLGGAHEVIGANYALAILIATIVVETGRITVIRRVAQRTGSAALAASAQNRFADILSAVAVLAGLVCVRLGLHWADAAAALVVAGIIARAAVLLAWRSGDILIDRAPRGVEDQVRHLASNVPGVREVREVRVRRSGARLLGDARVSTKRLLSVERAEALVQDVQRAVHADRPELDLTVVVEAQPREEHMVERVHAAAERLGTIRDLHNVTVERETDGSLHLSMHAKLPGDLRLEEATQASRSLESTLREEFPSVSRIDVHLEPLEPDLVPGHDVTGPRRDLAGEIRRRVEEHPRVVRCRDVELSDRGGHIIAHVVAEMPADVRLEEAHEVQTELEEKLRQDLPDLYEVVARVAPAQPGQT
ncbi:MAG: cation diffusion facilitator family transporter [Candidatus Dormibacteraeota bacterium]|nr:cation diffusion facilitator family transporter [Candidatus Dormibacteraeota bacterium]MBO0761076.1 cation diffusion facilitator family transporter [Candidatus Dormibacteraeota bacterium]